MMTPYEEINELIEKLKETNEKTLAGTDVEYFSESQLLSLMDVSKQLIDTAQKLVSSIGEA